MNRISKQLIKIANEINRTALDEQGDGSGFQSLHDHDNLEQDQLDAAEKRGKKYILHHKERGLWRIQACKTFKNSGLGPFYSVKKGAFGGFVESEKNLSHEGGCWIFDYAKVYGNAVIRDTAQVEEKAQVYENAYVGGNALISEEAKVYGSSEVFGDATVKGKANIYNEIISKGQITE